MKIVSRAEVQRYLSGAVVCEGDIMTEVGEVTLCWVEVDGVMVCGPCDIDQATAFAESYTKG